MKSQKKSFALCLILASFGMAQTGWSGHSYHHRYRRGGCSSEVKESTVSRAQKVLNEVSKLKDFQSATQFQEFVKSTSALSDTDSKLHSYLSVMGVDSNDANSISEFIGSRDQSMYIRSAEKNLNLTTPQADFLVETIKASALSGITE